MIDVRHTRLDHIFEMGLLIERLHLMKIYIECNSVILKMEVLKRFELFFYGFAKGGTILACVLDTD